MFSSGRTAGRKPTGNRLTLETAHETEVARR